ncbi:MAG TPA: hypothetical protein PLV45_09115, partial [bacterium]|nr:hypothetical protein [bacterium]
MKQSMCKNLRRVFSVWIVLIMLPISVMGFWEVPQLVDDTIVDAGHIRADFTCRIHDQNVDDAGLKRPGVDGWLSFEYDPPYGEPQVCLKHYVFNNRYNRDDEWSPSVTLPGIPSLKAWGQDVHGFYYRLGVDPSRGKPAAYISYLVTQYDINPELYINIVHYDGSVSEFSSFMLEGSVDEYSHTAIEMVGNDIFVLWDEVDPISDTRRLLMTFYKATTENSEEGGTEITFQKGSNVVLDADIPCVGELNYQAIMYPFNYETGSRIYRGAVCWQVNNPTEVYPIQAIGVKFESDEGGTISSAMQPIAISGNPGLYSVSLPKITVEPAYLETNENTV